MNCFLFLGRNNGIAADYKGIKYINPNFECHLFLESQMLYIRRSTVRVIIPKHGNFLHADGLSRYDIHR
jgi:hypothetical protein